MNKTAVLAAAVFLAAPTLLAADLEGRVTRIENILNNQRQSDLLLELQRLQQEVRQLRGLVDQQAYELDALKRQQKDQYLDLDARLRGQTGGSPAEPGPGPKSARMPERASGRGDAPLMSPSSVGGPGGPSGRDEPPQPAPLDLSSPLTAQPVGEREAYRNAFDLLKQRRYDEAVSAFNALLSRYPNGEFADNARYWLGETHYVKRDYAAALAEFRRVIENYPLSPKVAGSMLKVGYIQDEQKDGAAARATLEGLVRKFPESTEARLARGRLERMARDGR